MIDAVVYREEKKNQGLANVAACVYSEKERRTLMYKSDDSGLECAHTHTLQSVHKMCACAPNFTRTCRDGRSDRFREQTHKGSLLTASVKRSNTRF